jgi:hypothetical protein
MYIVPKIMQNYQGLCCCSRSHTQLHSVAEGKLYHSFRNYGTFLWDFKFSRRRVWCSELSSGLYCRVKWLSTDDRWWRQYAPLKRRSTIILHCSTTQKTALNMVLSYSWHTKARFFVCCSVKHSWVFLEAYLFIRLRTSEVSKSCQELTSI